MPNPNWTTLVIASAWTSRLIVSNFSLSKIESWLIVIDFCFCSSLSTCVSNSSKSKSLISWSPFLGLYIEQLAIHWDSHWLLLIRFRAIIYYKTWINRLKNSSMITKEEHLPNIKPFPLLFSSDNRLWASISLASSSSIRCPPSLWVLMSRWAKSRGWNLYWISLFHGSFTLCILAITEVDSKSIQN